MEAPILNEEIEKYWSLLSIDQKQSIISLIKSFVEPDINIDIDEYNKALNEAIARVEKGEFYTQEEVERMSKEW